MRLSLVFFLTIFNFFSIEALALRCQDIFAIDEVEVFPLAPTVKTEELFWVQTQNEMYSFHAELIRGRLHITAFLKLPGFQRRSHLRGHQLYDEMMAHFGVENIQSIVVVWGGGTSNFGTYMGLWRLGWRERDAALATWSGRQAKRYGFSRVENLQMKKYGADEEDWVIRLEFHRPFSEKEGTGN